MPADEIHRITDDASEQELGLDHIRTNSVAVQEDQQKFNEARARVEGYPQPLSFEQCMNQTWGMEPQPLAESEVPLATSAAVKAKLRESQEAGAVIPPLDRIREVPQANEGAGEGKASAEELPPAVPPAHLVDFHRALRVFEARLSVLEGSITGINVRMTANSRMAGGPAMAPAPSSGGALPNGDSAKASPPTPPAPVQSVQERRIGRVPGGVGGAGEPAGGEPLAAPPEAWQGGGASSASGSAPEATSEGHSAAARGKWPWAIVGLCAAAAGIWMAVANTGSGTREQGARLVESQVQGVGSYVRSEERDLLALRKRGDSARGLIAQLRTEAEIAKDGPDRIEALRRLDEAQKRAARGEVAEQGLQALQDVSGITLASTGSEGPARAGR